MACLANRLLVHTRANALLLECTCAYARKQMKCSSRYAINRPQTTLNQPTQLASRLWSHQRFLFFIQHRGISRGRPLSTAGHRTAARMVGTKRERSDLHREWRVGEIWKLNMSNLQLTTCDVLSNCVNVCNTMRTSRTMQPIKHLSLNNGRPVWTYRANAGNVDGSELWFFKDTFVNIFHFVESNKFTAT